MSAPEPAEPPGRHLRLEGAFNFRDAGGYPTTAGDVVRRGLLWRSDGLSRLSEADRARLHALGLRTVVDLRTLAEVAEHGRAGWPGAAFEYHNLPLLDVLPPADSYADTWTSPSHVAEQYLAMLVDGRPAMGRAMSLLADAGRYPLVVHCAAGKDRTGIVVAIALGMLGVADDDIVADYTLSAAAMARMLERLRAERPDQAQRWEASAAAMVSAEPETMRLFLGGLHDSYGSWGGLADALGHPGLPGALRSFLLDSAPASPGSRYHGGEGP